MRSTIASLARSREEYAALAEISNKLADLDVRLAAIQEMLKRMTPKPAAPAKPGA